jgi:hypothetical protein
MDSGTDDDTRVSVRQKKSQKRGTHKEGAVVVCLLRILGRGEPQHLRIHRAEFRKQQQSQKQLLDRLGDETSAKDQY